MVARGLGGFPLAFPALLAAMATGVGRFGFYAVVLVCGGLLGMTGWVAVEVYVIACDAGQGAPEDGAR